MTCSVRAALAACLLLAGLAGAEAAPHKLLTPADLDKLATVDEPNLSPDGKWVAYTVSRVNTDTDDYDTHIWMAKTDGTADIALTSRPKESEDHPRFSPDGRHLAYLSATDDAGGNSQLWIMDRRGGAAQKKTDFKGSVIDCAWSPDGARLVLVVADPDPGAPGPDAKVKTHKPIIIKRLRFMIDGDGYITDRHDHLYLFDVASKKTQLLTPGDYSAGLPAWSPDGRTIAFLAKYHPDPDRDYNWDLLTIPAHAGAKVTKIASEAAADMAPDRPAQPMYYPSFSPDGTLIAFLHNGDLKRVEYAPDYLAVVPAKGGAVRNLTPKLDRNVWMAKWSADGKSLRVIVEDDLEQYLAAVPLGGGPLTKLSPPHSAIYAHSGAGKTIAMLLTTPTQPSDIYVTDGKGAPRRIAHHNLWLADYKLAPLTAISVKTKDGAEVHGFRMRPPGASASGRLPTILRLHGGPQMQFDYEFDFGWQMLAAHGYQVIGVNPRGSSGRGEAWCAAVFGDWGGVPVTDVLSAVDDAVAKGLADPDRLGVGGWSYGGMLTNYVIASTTRFKVATSGAGISNALTGYGTDQYVNDYEAELGKPWVSIKPYLKVSYPFFHADRIKTPTLFLGGTADMNVPLINGEQMYEALKSLGVETELAIYPGQFHGFQTPSYNVDVYQRYLSWYDAHLRK